MSHQARSPHNVFLEAWEYISSHLFVLIRILNCNHCISIIHMDWGDIGPLLLLGVGNSKVLNILHGHILCCHGLSVA